MNSRSITSCTFIGWLFAFYGCAVGPDFHIPTTQVPSQWPDSAQPYQTTLQSPFNQTQFASVQWWETFQDPILVSLVERARQSNLDLQQATARVRQARAERSIVISGEFPQLNVFGSYNRSNSGRGRDVSGTSNTSSLSQNTKDIFQSGFDASWELDVFGGLRREIEAADADLQAQEEDRRDVFVTLAAELALNYINLRGFQQEIAITKENLTTQQNTADLTRKRFQAGFVSGLDVANADAQVAATLSQIPPLEAQAQKAIYTLSVLLGLEPDALTEEISKTQPLPDSPIEIPLGLPSELMKRRPDIRRAEEKLHSATARVGVATADLFPKFSLTGLLGVQGGNIASLTKWRNRSWSFGPGINFPFFDAGRIRANITVHNALQEQALLEYQKSILTALSEVANALVDYTREQEHQGALMNVVLANEKALSLAKTLYTEGATDFLNVLTAERALYASQDALVKSNRSRNLNLVALYKALGGGWEVERSGEHNGSDKEQLKITAQ